LGPFGATELIIILVLALIIFGPGKLPDVGRAIGKSLREFKRASSGIEDDGNGAGGSAKSGDAKAAGGESGDRPGGGAGEGSGGGTGDAKGS